MQTNRGAAASCNPWAALSVVFSVYVCVCVAWLRLMAKWNFRKLALINQCSK